MTETQPSGPSRPDTTSIPDGTYTADPNESVLRFKAKAFTLAWVHGHIPATAGTMHVAGGRLTGTGTLAAAEIDTGLAARDWHLRTSHYLHTKKHPEITLTVDNADLTAGRVDCSVTVRDAVRTVPLTITSLEHRGGRVQLEASVALDRTIFPMLPPAAGVSRIVDIDLTVVANKT